MRFFILSAILSGFFLHVFAQTGNSKAAHPILNSDAASIIKENISNRPLPFQAKNLQHKTMLYGQLVFESEKPGAGWDGILGGRPQDGGTYVWSCSYQFAGDTPKLQKGTVVLIR